jgi:flagellar biosynthesis protein FlhG
VSQEESYSFREALLLSGLQEARFRYLEKEFGPYLGIKSVFFLPSLYSARQVALLRKIEAVIRHKSYSPEAVKNKIQSYLDTCERGIWVAAVTSGKGGVGKTSMAVNVAVSLSRLGVKPTVVDADLGLANAHLLLGVLPEKTLDDLIRGTAGLEDILMDSGYGICLVPGGSGISALADLPGEARETLAAEVRKLYYHTDTIVIDTGSGISANVMRFLNLANEIVVVAAPNSASLIDALGVIRTAAESGIEGRINVLVNRCRGQDEGREVFSKLSRSVLRLTGRSLRYLGFVPEDRHLEESFQRGVPVTSLYAACRASCQIRSIARALLAGRQTSQPQDQDDVFQLFRGLAGAG